MLCLAPTTSYHSQLAKGLPSPQCHHPPPIIDYFVKLYKKKTDAEKKSNYSCIGWPVEIIANDQGHQIMPSWVSFTEDERLVRDSAKNAFHTNPKNTVFDAKRLIGREMDNNELKQDIRHWPFDIIDKAGKPAIQINYRSDICEFTSEEISAMVLMKMKETAEVYLSEKVTHAIVTIPAYFNNAQHQVTKDASTIAGLQVLHIINEPTIAAITYSLNKKDGESQIIIYDLGGGAFDISLLSINDGVFELYKKKMDTDITSNLHAMGKLKREVEKVKWTLLSQQSTQIEIESFEDGNDFSKTLTRAKFEELNMDHFRKTMKHVEQVFKDANVKKEDINEVVLVDGSTHIPKVQQLLKEYFNDREPSKGINSNEAIAYGAAVQCGILLGKQDTEDVVLVDVCPLILGIKITGGVFTKLIPHNTIIPIFLMAADNQPTVLIQVYEGEQALTKDNNLLGKFKLSSIPLASRGVPQIEVSFKIDVNDIMKVNTTNKGIGKSESITIMNEKGCLSKEDAEEFTLEDNTNHKHIKSLNSLSLFMFGLESQLVDQSGLVGKIEGKDKKILLLAIKEMMK
ncbi:heat shock protein 70 [Boletus coccyginus]|nr:heat shock protein 70 [Boletus coccyginus]